VKNELVQDRDTTQKTGGSKTASPSSFAAPVHARKQKPGADPEVYWWERTPVDFYSFDEEYLRRLGARDPATEAHFVGYFSEHLKIIMRARGVDANTIDDVRQETFCRVLVAVRSGSVNNPRGFGAYVHAVGKNVLSEIRRDDNRNQHDPLESTDVADEQLRLDEIMERQELAALVRAILDELPERDRKILHARFFEDRDNDEVCGAFGVDRDYLRVLVHRAINRFGDLYRKKRSN
jgi:RNA polymerase sigma-70 factor (ECF subfamily)